MKSKARSSQEVEDEKFDMLLEDGMNVFVLRMKRANKENFTVMGFEQIEVNTAHHPNTGETNYQKRTIRHKHTTFYPDKHNIPTAKVIDTPYNRDLLATTFWNNTWVIASMITPTGTVVGAVVRAEIEKVARDKYHLAPPTFVDGFEQQVEARTLTDVKKRLTPEEIGLEIESKNKETITYLKKKFGENYRKSEQYKEVIKPQIQTALDAYGYTADVLARMKAEKSVPVLQDTVVSTTAEPEESSLVKA